MNYHKGKDGSLKPIKIDFYQWIRSIFDKPLYERTGEYPWENKPLPETPKIREQLKESIIQKQVPLKSDYSLSELNYPDRKSTRLNSSHRCISYAVFCLKKKKRALSYG